MIKILKNYIKKLFHENLKALTENAVENFSTGYFKKAENQLKTIFDKRLKKLPANYRSFLENFILQISYKQINQGSFEKKQKQLFEKTFELKDSTLNLNQWLDLQYLSIRFGMFQASKAFREKAKEKVYRDLHYNTKNLPALINAFNASIDCSDTEMASYVLKITKENSEFSPYRQMLFYFSLFENNVNKIKPPCQKLDKTSHEYLRYISGKSIAIVGPAPPDENNGEQIDLYDIVIRNGYKGIKYQPDAKKFGLRTDVSYYGDGNSRFYIVDQDSAFLQDIDWAVFKHERYAKHAVEIDKNRRRCFIKNPFYFSGSPTMIENIVFDILHFNPEKIKLFNLNFNLAKITHYKTYGPKDQNIKMLAHKKLWTNQQRSTFGFAHHDLLSQINFVRNLWINGKIQVDNGCKKVLNMSNEEYLKQMERKYILPFFSS
ncbi:MAG: hypothetical protein ACOCUL_02850 [Bacteroidota bacterium]